MTKPDEASGLTSVEDLSQIEEFSEQKPEAEPSSALSSPLKLLPGIAMEPGRRSTLPKINKGAIFPSPLPILQDE